MKVEVRKFVTTEYKKYRSAEKIERLIHAEISSYTI